MNRAKGNGLWPWIVRFKRFLYIATGKGEKKDQRHINDSNRKIKKSDFSYDENRDCFVFLAGHSSELNRGSRDGKKVYQAVKALES